MEMGLFKKGYNAVREEKERQDVNREKMGKQLWRMFLAKDGDEARMRFLTEEPVNFYEHTLKVYRNGKEVYDNVICTSAIGECPHCEAGERASFKGAYLVYDMRPYEYTDAKGKKQQGEGQLRLYVQGARVLSQLDRLSQRYGLTNRDYILTRSGSGTSTTYMFDRGDDVRDLSPDDILKILPEKLKDDFRGTMESLYEIVEEQLQMQLASQTNTSFAPVKDEDEDDDMMNKLVSFDDDELEEDIDIPTKRPEIKKPLGFKTANQNSVKSLFKNK